MSDPIASGQQQQPTLSRRRLLGALTALPLTGVLAACSFDPLQRPAPDQLLRTFLWTSYETLDPLNTASAVDAEYVVQIFSGLMGLNDKLEVVPDLAEKQQLSQDGKTYTFTLRKGVQFHDGKPLRAQDVQYSLERVANPNNHSPVARTYLGDIAGFDEYQQGKAQGLSGIKVRDDQTVEITLIEPRVDFLARLTYPVAYVVDKANVESGGPMWWTHANGSGPFRVREAKLGESLILARNDHYYGAKPALAEAHFIPVIPLPSYEAGQVDIAQVELGDIDRVTDKSDPLSRELHVRSDLDIKYLGFNVTAKPFDDVKVRQAFNHALDRDKIVNVTLKKTVIKALGILPPGMPGRNEQVNAPDFDVSRARQLIAESSYRDVQNFPEIVLTIAGTRTDAPAEITAIAAMYRQNLGVDIKVRQMDYDAFTGTLSKGNKLQFFSLGWVADYADPQNFLDLLFHSDSPENHTQYANPDVDKLLEQARTERDPAARMREYSEAEAQILRDCAWVPLWHSKHYVLVKPYVHGYTSPPMVLPWLRSISLSAHPGAPKLPASTPAAS